MAYGGNRYGAAPYGAASGPSASDLSGAATVAQPTQSGVLAAVLAATMVGAATIALPIQAGVFDVEQSGVTGTATISQPVQAGVLNSDPTADLSGAAIVGQPTQAGALAAAQPATWDPTTMLGPSAGGVHPNDLGMTYLADCYEATLAAGGITDLTGLPLIAYGDSWTAQDIENSVGLRAIVQLANRLNGTLTNRAVSASQAWDVAKQAVRGAPYLPGTTGVAVVANVGLNDLLDADTPALRRAVADHLRATFAVMAAAQRIENTSFTYGAGWTQNTFAGSSGGTNRSTTTNNASATFTITTAGDYYLLSHGANGTTTVGGVLTVSQGGVDLASIDLNEDTSPNNVGSVALRIPSVATGTLTIKFTTLGRSGAIGWIDALLRIPAVAANTILAVKPVRVLEPTRNKPALLGYIRDTYDDLAAEFGPSVLVCDPEPGWVPTENLLGAAAVPQPTQAGVLDVDTSAALVGVSVVPQPAQAGVLEVTAPTLTQTSNRAGGRTRSGLGVATFDPPLVDLPATMVRGLAYPTVQAFGAVTMVGNQPHFTAATARGVQTRYQILYGNRDITYLFGVPTPPIEFQRAQPFDEGPGTLRLPQFSNPQETAGVGRWSWLKVKKPVRYRIIRVSDNAVLKTFRFISTGFDTDGPNLSVQLAGRATGRMGLRDQQAPVFASTQKPKKLIARVFESIGVPFDRSSDGPDFEMGRFGDTGMLDYAQQILARCWNSSGRQWTVMPDADGVYGMALRDNTTVHCTIYLDDARTSGSLHRDISEEPNAIYGRGTTPDGLRVLNGVYPGLVKIDPKPPYPYDGGDTFGLGTTNADTDSGDGVSVLLARLQTLGKLTRNEAARADGTFTQDVVDAVNEIQDEAGVLPQTGTVYEDFWDVLFNAGAVGYSVWWSKIEPMAWARNLRRWKRTGDGVIIDKNPTFDAQAASTRVDRTIDFEAGLEGRQMRANAKRELDAANDPNWVGPITLNLGAVVRGDHTQGDPITEADVMADWEIDPGMNAKVVTSAGGELLVGIGGITYGSSTQLTVDTRQRDALPIWEVIRRNKESRRDLNRRANNQRRASSESKDVLYPVEEYGGQIEAVPVPGQKWKVFPVVMGKAGQVTKTRVRTRGAVSDAETPVVGPTRFVFAVFGKEIPASFLTANQPDPITNKGAWYDEDFRDRLRDEFNLCYIVGEPGGLAGYSPHVQTDADATVTGLWEDDSSWSFETGIQPVLYAAYFGEDDSIIAGGRIFWNQEIVGS